MENLHIERGSFISLNNSRSSQYNKSNSLKTQKICHAFRISHIYKNIYIGDNLNSNNIDELCKLNIKAILHLGTYKKHDNILELYKKSDINYNFLEINYDNNFDISKCFDPAWVYMNNTSCNILIQCNQGISRSPIIVAYFLTRKLYEKGKCKSGQLVVDDILTLIKINRPCSNPNKIFIKQLKNYENIAFG